MSFVGECVKSCIFGMSQNIFVRQCNVFNPKSKCQLPQDNLCLEDFSSQVENELFELPKADIKYPNLSWEEWNAIGSLVDDRNIFFFFFLKKKVFICFLISMYKKSKYENTKSILYIYTK